MAMGCDNLRSALARKPIGPARVAGGHGDLEDLIRNAQNRFKPPHRRDYGYRLPLPFRWGPNGSLMLLGIMLAIGALVFVVAWLSGLRA